MAPPTCECGITVCGECQNDICTWCNKVYCQKCWQTEENDCQHCVGYESVFEYMRCDVCDYKACVNCGWVAECDRCEVVFCEKCWEMFITRDERICDDCIAEINE